MRHSGKGGLVILLAAIVGAGFGASLGACAKDVAKSSPVTDTAVSAAPAGGATASRGGGLQPYVGYRYDPLPAGATYEGGSVIMGSDGTPSSFVLSHVMTPLGDMVWLDSILSDDRSARHARIVRAVLPVDRVQAGQRLFIGTCDVNGKLDGAVVAIGADRATNGKFSQIAMAWRGNGGSASFDTLPVTDVTCENPDGA